MIGSLIRMGVDESAVNDDGKTPWGVAVDHQNSLALLSLIAVRIEQGHVAQP